MAFIKRTGRNGSDQVAYFNYLESVIPRERRISFPRRPSGKNEVAADICVLHRNIIKHPRHRGAARLELYRIFAIFNRYPFHAAAVKRIVVNYSHSLWYTHSCQILCFVESTFPDLRYGVDLSIQRICHLLRDTCSPGMPLIVRHLTGSFIQGVIIQSIIRKPIRPGRRC